MPVLDLPAGAQRIEGRFVWSRVPEQLPVPPEYGQLRAAGARAKPVPHPKRDASGSLWLREGQADSGPAQLESPCSGRSRTPCPCRSRLGFGFARPGRRARSTSATCSSSGTVPLSITAELPVRLDPNGELRLQIRAGRVQRARARPHGWARGRALEPAAACRRGLRKKRGRFSRTKRCDKCGCLGRRRLTPRGIELDADRGGLPTFLLAATDKLAFSGSAAR